MKILSSLRSQRSIGGGAAVLALTGLLSSAMGFFRDQAFSIMFPPGTDTLDVASVYIAAFRPSDVIFQISILSCLSVVMVPFLSGHLAHGRREEMDRVTTSVTMMFGAGFALCALLLAIAMPTVASHFVHFTGASLQLYIRTAQLALLTNALFVVGNSLGQYLIASQRYWVYGLTPALWALGTVGGTYGLSPFLGADGPMAGTIIGTVLYVLWRYLAVRSLGFRFRGMSAWTIHPDLRGMGIMIIPRMIALGALQIQLLLLDRLASGLPQGLLAINQFARNAESVIPGIVGIAIAQSSFSLLSQSAALRDHKRLDSTLHKGIQTALLLSSIGAVCAALLAPLGALILRIPQGSMDAFVLSLRIYAIAIPFESITHVLLRGCYARKDTVIPALSTSINACAAVAVATIRLPSDGILALAEGFVIGSILQCIILLLASNVLRPLRRTQCLTPVSGSTEA